MAIAVPVLSISDNAAAATGVVATVTSADATATVRLDYQRVDSGFSYTTWTQGNDRTGNGTISQSLARGIYWFRLISTLSGESAVSNLVLSKVTTGADAVHEQCLDAIYTGVVTLIAAGSLPGINSSDAARNLSDLDLKRMDLPGIAVCLSMPNQVPGETIGRGTNARDDIGYPVYVILLDRFGGDFVSARADYLRCREVLFRYFRFQRLAATDAHIVRAEPGPVLAIQQGDYQLAGSVLLFRPEIRDVRG